MCMKRSAILAILPRLGINTVTLLFNLLSITQTTDLLHLGNIQYRKAVKCDNTYERHEKPETIIYIGTQQ